MIINEKSEFTLDYDGGLALIAESEASWNKMMRSVGITEEILRECGTEILNEGFKEFLVAVKEWLSKMIHKIKTFFREYISRLKLKCELLREKIKKAEKAESKNSTVKHEASELGPFKGFIFTNLDRHSYCPLLTKKPKYTDEGIDEEIKNYEKKLTDGKYMDDELDERLKKYFRDGKTEKSDVTSYYKSLDIRNESDNIWLIIPKVKATIDALEKTLEGAKRDIDLDSDDIDYIKSLKNAVTIFKIQIGMALQYENARLSAINEALAQLCSYIHYESLTTSTNESYLSKFLDKIVL